MKRILSFVTGLAVSGSLLAQLPVSTNPSNKNVLLEDLTGIYCGYCPDGALRADQLKAAAGADRVVIIGNHAGSYANPQPNTPNHLDFRTNDGATVNSLSDPSGYPAGNINRMVTNLSMKPGKTAMSRGYWSQVAGDNVLNQPSPLNLAVEAYYYPASNEIKINVEGYYTSNGNGDDYLTVAILQDNILSYQSGASSYPARVDPSTGLYNQMDVLRGYVTSPTLGEKVSTTSMGTKFEKSYTYQVTQVGPDVVPVIEDMKVAVWMTEDATWSEVITAVETEAAERPVGVNEATSLNDLNIFPNPFETNATVSFNLDKEERIAINFYDVTGKVVQQVPSAVYPVGQTQVNFDGSNLESGLYYVNIVAETGIVTRKIVLNK